MDVTRTLRPLLLAALAVATALALLATPALAVDEPGGSSTEQTSESGSGRPQVAGTPRQQLGLLLYGALVVFTVGGIATFNRQLKGERPQASGAFRWR